jgi:phenylalanyl-tRNA synthetase beta chain
VVAISLKFVEQFISLPTKMVKHTILNQTFTRETWDVDTIAPLLTRQGFEVEGTSEFGAEFDLVVVGKIVEAHPHPNASKLQVCKVDVGEGSLRQIVCGAPNARVDLFVAVALPGASLPAADGKKLEIKASAIRGEESHGMLCSRAELGLPVKPETDGNGIWELDINAQGGQSKDVLGNHLGHSVFSALCLRDVSLELNVLANRPDMRSHAGVARELEVGFRMAGIPFKRKSLVFPSLVSEGDLVSSVLKNSQISADGKVFTAENELGVSAFFLVLEGVTPVPSPAWLRNILEAAGQNSINNIVDASNFILLAHGQPSHAFDLAKLAASGDGSKKIVLRMAKTNESFLGLDGKERALSSADCIVADSAEPQALLGVIGGEKSKVDGSSRTIVIEIANPHPVAVRRASRRHGRLTESSMAFEKGIDSSARFEAACALVGLMAATSPQPPRYAGAIHSKLLPRNSDAAVVVPQDFVEKNLGPSLKAGIAIDASVLASVSSHEALKSAEWRSFADERVRAHTFHFPKNALAKIVGSDIVTWEKSLEILANLGFKVCENTTGATVVTPHWRWHDITAIADLVEEVVRVVGIDTVPSVPLTFEASLTKDDEHIAVFENIIQKTIQLGYIETAGYHFLREDDLAKLGLAGMSALGEPVVLLNPIIRDEPMMHTTLLPDLLRKTARNISYGTRRGMICHICRTYQNLSKNGERVFADNGVALDIDKKLGTSPSALFDYSPKFALQYSREKDQSRRPAETPRLAAVLFGDRVPKTWQSQEAIKWDLHFVMAHVYEISRSEGVEISFQELPESHPFAAALHPGRRVGVFANINDAQTLIGWAAEFHPQALRNFEVSEACLGFELNLSILLEARNSTRSASVSRITVPRRFPTVVRDFAFVIAESVSGKELIDSITEGLNSSIGVGKVPAKTGRTDIFDIYRGKGVQDGYKSVAASVSIEPTERTLTDADIQKIGASIVEFVKSKIGGELRG